MAGILSERGVDAAEVSAQVGEHGIVVRIPEGLDAGVRSVDIPPSVYETGSAATVARGQA